MLSPGIGAACGCLRFFDRERAECGSFGIFLGRDDADIGVEFHETIELPADLQEFADEGRVDAEVGRAICINSKSRISPGRTLDLMPIGEAETSGQGLLPLGACRRFAKPRGELPVRPGLDPKPTLLMLARCIPSFRAADRGREGGGGCCAASMIGTLTPHRPQNPQPPCTGVPQAVQNAAATTFGGSKPCSRRGSAPCSAPPCWRANCVPVGGSCCSSWFVASAGKGARTEEGAERPSEA